MHSDHLHMHLCHQRARSGGRGWGGTPTSIVGQSGFARKDIATSAPCSPSARAGTGHRAAFGAVLAAFREGAPAEVSNPSLPSAVAVLAGVAAQVLVFLFLLKYTLSV